MTPERAATIAQTHNTARFFTETRHVAWVLLIGTVLWGVYGYLTMPQRKDPDIPVRQALALCPWPGASAEKIEQLVTRRIEEKIAENVKVDKIESNTRTGVTAVYITLVEGVTETGKEFDDIKLKLDCHQRPARRRRADRLREGLRRHRGADADGGEPAGRTPPRSSARPRRPKAIEASARRASAAGSRVTLVHGLPPSVPLRRSCAAGAPVCRGGDRRRACFATREIIAGPGFVGIDGDLRPGRRDAARVRAALHPRAAARVRVPSRRLAGGRHSRSGASLRAQLAAVAGDKYSYRELDDYTDLIARTLKTLPMVSKVTRPGCSGARLPRILAGTAGVLRRQGRRARRSVLGARNIAHAGRRDRDRRQEPHHRSVGRVQERAGDRRRRWCRRANGRARLPARPGDVGRGYESPARFLNFFGQPDEDGSWHRTRAITLAVQMRAGEKIGDFGAAVDAQLDELARRSCPTTWCSRAPPISRGRSTRTSISSWAACTKRSRWSCWSR